MNYANYSNEEIYRLTDTLPMERIEQLLDGEKLNEKLSDIESCLMDAIGAMPDEGCFQDDIDALLTLAKDMRGANRHVLTSIIQSLTESRNEMVQSVAYAVDEINKYIGELS